MSQIYAFFLFFKAHLKNCIQNKKGITLTELILGTILIGIIMVGVASFSLSTQNMQKTEQETSLLALRMATAISHLNRTGNLAIGDATDAGIVLGDISGGGGNPSVFPSPPAAQVGAEWISFRQDADGNPSDYSADIWNIYYIDTNMLYYCQQPAGTGVAQGPGPKINGAPANPCRINNAQMILKDVSTFNFNFLADATIPVFYADVDLTIIFNPLAPPNPLSNPTFNGRTKISPPSHSWNL